MKKKIINNEIIQTFLNCRYKAFLKNNNKVGIKKEYELLESELLEMYRTSFFNKLRSKTSKTQLFEVIESDVKCQGLKSTYVIEPVFQSNEYFIKFDAIEITPPKAPITNHLYTVISISPKEKVTKVEKLILSIKCIILSGFNSITPECCKIIYGRNLKSTGFALKIYVKEANRLLKELSKAVSNADAPSSHHNNHCPICEFQKGCWDMWMEKDDLSLLGRMSQKEQNKLNNRGFFTVHQLSYTYRPKKRRGKSKKPQRLDYSLKALSIRENQTHIIEIPKLPISKTEIYFDIESLPEENFIYLIGVIVIENGTKKQFSFWKDSQSDQDVENLFRKFISTIFSYRDFRIYHYGSYEIRFLKNINKKLDNKYNKEIEFIVNKSVNILSFFTSHIYPPTFNNSLKDIANYLGFKWADKNASGIQSIVWRKKWELTNEIRYKNKLIQYNINDCEALCMIKKWISGIEIKLLVEKDDSFIRTSDLRSVSYQKWGKPNFQIPEFEEINKCSYFDYQRSKIYLRTNKNIKKAINRKRKYIKRVNKLDKIVNSLPVKCPNCRQDKFYRLNNTKKLIINIKFMKNGIKKWNMQLPASAFQCSNCGDEFSFNKYGRNLMIWVMNQYILYLTSIPKIGNMILEYFNIYVPEYALYNFKSDLAKEYQSTYEEIKQLLINGTLIHVDETKAAVRGNPDGYVWVFTSMDTVYYLYRPNREAGFLKDMLKEFKGVLISDFYSGYYSLPCAQQKCLIHLIRDLNGDLLNNQLNTEYRNIIVQFGKLLREIIQTIDKYGLRKKYLNKHKKDVESYYHQILHEDYETELAISWQKRFRRNKGKLFNFLNYDDIPWNNNNAENAIKPFAKFRGRAKGVLREEGVKDFLVLLSIQQTYKYRGTNFLNFLKSGKIGIEEYCRTH